MLARQMHWYQWVWFDCCKLTASWPVRINTWIYAYLNSYLSCTFWGQGLTLDKPVNAPFFKCVIWLSFKLMWSSSRSLLIAFVGTSVRRFLVNTKWERVFPWDDKLFGLKDWSSEKLEIQINFVKEIQVNEYINFKIL